MEKNKNESNDWRNELDNKLSFTETDSRRRRITHEMIKAQNSAEGFGEFELSDSYRESIRNTLRNKLKEQGSLDLDEMLDLGEFPGALYDRNPLDLKEMYGEELPYEPSEMIRLHLELVADFTEEEKEILHQYGSMEKDTITRDILVSEDLPLYALHYVIQRAFGWQNSHLHRFHLTNDRVASLTESVEQWMDQVGVIYRSPLMDDQAEFWADDYRRGSFKNWLRKKYTGPCVSQCWDEGLIGARESLEELNLDKEYYVEYGYFGEEVKKPKPLCCIPLYNWDGEKNNPPQATPYVHEHRVELVKARDLPVSLLNFLFERGAFDLLERLPIGEVLSLHNMHYLDDFQEDDDVSSFQEMLDDGLDDEIEEILESQIDSPMKQPYVYSFTDELIYHYDFGCDWEIKITGSRNCMDLVESGKISQEMLDKSNIKARVTYRPVLLARDGEMLLDDVGGPSGFVEFIKKINTMKRGERDENDMTKTDLKAWAKSLGWHRDNSTDFNLI